MGRGVYATNTVQSNDKLAAIPISLLFTLTNAHKLLRSILPTNKKDSFIQLGPIDTLSLALIIEYQNEHSFWNLYLKCLPTVNEIKYDLQHPLYWKSDENTQYLQSSKVAMFMNRRMKSIQDSYSEISQILQSISYMKDVLHFTLDDWIWALSIVWSRSFSVIFNFPRY